MRKTVSSILIFLAVLAVIITSAILKNKPNETIRTVSPTVVATDSQNETFKQSLTNALNDTSNRQTTFAPMFDNVRVSGWHDYTFAPEIVSAGLSYDGKTYVAIVNTHRDGQDVFYRVVGSAKASGQISSATATQEVVS